MTPFIEQPPCAEIQEHGLGKLLPRARGPGRMFPDCQDGWEGTLIGAGFPQPGPPADPPSPAGSGAPALRRGLRGSSRLPQSAAAPSWETLWTLPAERAAWPGPSRLGRWRGWGRVGRGKL